MRLTHSGKEPFWKSAACVHRENIPSDLRTWLFDKNSLTTRLMEASDGQFSVKVESEKWCLPQRNERLLLGLRHGEYVFVRQVYLLCKGTPWVFARSIIPVKAANGQLKGLTRLGNKSLGSVLFNNPNIQRSGIALTQVSAQHDMFATATTFSKRKASQIWGRRSKYTIRNQPLLVSEFFLPDLELTKTSDKAAKSLNSDTKTEKTSFWDTVSRIFGGSKEKTLSH